MLKNLVLRTAALAVAVAIGHANAAGAKPINVPAGDLQSREVFNFSGYPSGPK